MQVRGKEVNIIILALNLLKCQIRLAGSQALASKGQLAETVAKHRVLQLLHEVTVRPGDFLSPAAEAVPATEQLNPRDTEQLGCEAYESF